MLRSAVMHTLSLSSYNASREPCLLADPTANLMMSEQAEYQLHLMVKTCSEEEEEEFYKLRPANKTDHLCQSWH